ncbi:hypothetical protein, partial [Nocardiopsis metallicus]|uniref:hypothetical protein n=1 Tax=Nocardiopsis metallicus TaxID=179819 RepID=UPI0031E083AB
MVGVYSAPARTRRPDSAERIRGSGAVKASRGWTGAGGGSAGGAFGPGPVEDHGAVEGGQDVGHPDRGGRGHPRLRPVVTSGRSQPAGDAARTAAP